MIGAMKMQWFVRALILIAVLFTLYAIVFTNKVHYRGLVGGLGLIAAVAAVLLIQRRKKNGRQ